MKSLLVTGESDGRWYYKEGCISDEWRQCTTVIDQDTSSRGVPREFTELWAPDESQPNGLVDLQPLMEHGQTLCD